MKYTGLYILMILCCVCGRDASAQVIKAEPRSIHINNTPEIVIEKATLLDENNNNEVDAGERCFLEIVIRNAGNGVARLVNIFTTLDSETVNGFSMSHAIYAGNLIEGKEYTFKLRLFPQISMKDGFADIRLKAYEAGGFNSEPLFARLTLRSRNQSIAVGWINPIERNITVYDPEIGVKACIVSDRPIDEIRVFMNGEIHDTGSDMELFESESCDYEFDAGLTLREGVNRIYLELDNGRESVSSDTLSVTYDKVRMEHRQALVIGNGAYEVDPLRNPPNDARDMAATLRELKFDVIELINGDRQQMRDSIRKFNEQLVQYKGVGLFYYAGHGAQVDGENFLIPVRYDIQHDEEVEDEAIRVNTVLTYMQNSGTRMNIIILDACRNNPWASSDRSATRGLAQIYAEGSGSLIAYSTAPGSVASDGDGENGLYTQELLEAMQTPGLEIGLIFRRVLTNVKKISNGEQIPWTSASIEGEFYFKK